MIKTTSSPVRVMSFDANGPGTVESDLVPGLGHAEQTGVDQEADAQVGEVQQEVLERHPFRRSENC